MNKTKRFLSIVLAVIFLAYSINLIAIATTTATSRTIVIESISGDVEMTRGTDRTFAARTGTRLAAGNTLSTGRNSSAVLLLDDNSTVTLNSSTKIDISRSSNNLMITLVNGSISVNAAAQATGTSTTVRAGNSTMGVRGTLFTVVFIDGVLHVVLLEGEIEGRTPDGGYTLGAGFVLHVSNQLPDDMQERVSSIQPLVLEELDRFTLELIMEYSEMLIEIGIFTEEELESLGEMIEELIAQEEAAETERLREIEEFEEALSEQIEEVRQYLPDSVEEPTTEPPTEPAGGERQGPPDGWEPPTEPTTEPTTTTESTTETTTGATGSSVIEINNAADLMNISNNLSGNYVLMNDINDDVGDLINIENPINGTFTGTFDGGGFSIYLEMNSSNNSGLFREIGSGGIVRNLHVTGLIDGSQTASHTNVGGIAGINRGTIERCSSSVWFGGEIEIIGGSIGGIAGINYGTIRDSYFADGEIERHIDGSTRVGGIAGINSGSGEIINCYSSGNVSGNNYIGGIAGDNVGSIINCVALMSSLDASSTPPYIGRISGENTGTLNDNYAWADMEVRIGGVLQTTLTPTPAHNNIHGGDMAAIAQSYFVGWDFIEIWEWHSSGPVLRQ